MLLADGHVVYYGGAGEVIPWFSHLGFACPYGVNVAGAAEGQREGSSSPDGPRFKGREHQRAAAHALSSLHAPLVRLRQLMLDLRSNSCEEIELQPRGFH